MLFQVEDFVKGGIVESGQVVQVIWDSTLYPAKILTSSEDELKINRVVNKLIEAKTNFDPALESIFGLCNDKDYATKLLEIESG